ncbi:MAG: hypothetical protein R6X35_09990 [Candidatus Krumholzibacteriia bacterium]
MTHRFWFRPALVVLAVAALGVAACTTPTEYEITLGQRVTMQLDGPGKAAVAAVDAVAAWLEARPGVEGVMVQLQESVGADGGVGAVGTVMVWGQALQGDGLRADLVAAFPDLDPAEITVEALAGTALGSLAEAMGHTVLGLEVDGETAEEVRAGILAQLAAAGYSGDAAVTVVDEDGRRTVNVELNDVEGGEGGSGEVVVGLEKKD